MTPEAAPTSRPVVLVIAGSVRATRRSPAVAAWVAGLGRQACGGIDFEVVDLETLGLELDDEPHMASKGVYERETTRAWSRRVAGAAAVAFVTPQYNWGYPAALKNAIDHLYAEWRDKPALIVTYGGHGGGKCAAQLRQVLDGLKAKALEAMPALTLSPDRITADDGGLDPDVDFAAWRDEVTAALRGLVGMVGGKHIDCYH